MEEHIGLRLNRLSKAVDQKIDKLQLSRGEMYEVDFIERDAAMVHAIIEVVPKQNLLGTESEMAIAALGVSKALELSPSAAIFISLGSVPVIAGVRFIAGRLSELGMLSPVFERILDEYGMRHLSLDFRMASTLRTSTYVSVELECTEIVLGQIKDCIDMIRQDQIGEFTNLTVDLYDQIAARVREEMDKYKGQLSERAYGATFVDKFDEYNRVVVRPILDWIQRIVDHMASSKVDPDLTNDEAFTRMVGDRRGKWMSTKTVRLGDAMPLMSPGAIIGSDSANALVKGMNELDDMANREYISVARPTGLRADAIIMKWDASIAANRIVDSPDMTKDLKTLFQDVVGLTRNLNAAAHGHYVPDYRLPSPTNLGDETAVHAFYYLARTHVVPLASQLERLIIANAHREVDTAYGQMLNDVRGIVDVVQNTATPSAGSLDSLASSMDQSAKVIQETDFKTMRNMGPKTRSMYEKTMRKDVDSMLFFKQSMCDLMDTAADAVVKNARGVGIDGQQVVQAISNSTVINESNAPLNSVVPGNITNSLGESLRHTLAMQNEYKNVSAHAEQVEAECNNLLNLTDAHIDRTLETANATNPDRISAEEQKPSKPDGEPPPKTEPPKLRTERIGRTDESGGALIRYIPPAITAVAAVGKLLGKKVSIESELRLLAKQNGHLGALDVKEKLKAYVRVAKSYSQTSSAIPVKETIEQAAQSFVHQMNVSTWFSSVVTWAGGTMAESTSIVASMQAEKALNNVVGFINIFLLDFVFRHMDWLWCTFDTKQHRKNAVAVMGLFIACAKASKTIVPRIIAKLTSKAIKDTDLAVVLAAIANTIRDSSDRLRETDELLSAQSRAARTSDHGPKIASVQLLLAIRAIMTQVPTHPKLISSIQEALGDEFPDLNASLLQLAGGDISSQKDFVDGISSVSQSMQRFYEKPVISPVYLHNDYGPTALSEYYSD